MRIEKKVTYYGYDLIINHVWHKKCLNCGKWYEFDGEMGFCKRCILWMEDEQIRMVHKESHARYQKSEISDC